MNRRSAPQWRGRANISDVDETGATAAFRSQTFKVARYCGRKKEEEKAAEAAESDPLQGRTRSMRAAPWGNRTWRNEENEMEAEEAEGGTTSSSEATRDGFHTHMEPTPAPDSPRSSARAPSSPRFSARHPAPEPLSDRNREQSQAPVVGRTKYGKLTWGQRH